MDEALERHRQELLRELNQPITHATAGWPQFFLGGGIFLAAVIAGAAVLRYFNLGSC